VFARSTTVVAHPDSIDAGIRHVRDEVMPNLMTLDGCIGLSMLVDRASRRCIITSAWESEEAMAASEAQLDPIRNHLAEGLGGRPQVDQWEFAVLHRDHRSDEGACVRATWFRPELEDLDWAIDIYKLAVLPGMAELPGFCSASLMVDRESGICVSSATYDSNDNIDAARGNARELRDRFTTETGSEILDICEFELVLAHLHVPEMA